MARKLALIIGNSQYEDTGLARLAAPDVDVTALAEVLQTPGIGAFDEVTPLLNEGLATVRKAIARFFDAKHRDDLLLLYFSGHGVRDEQGHLYLAVRDTERAVLAGTAIEASYVTTRMDRSASKRLVLVLDCCHSGAFGVGSKAAQGAAVGTATAFEGTGRGRVVLTATDSTQYAWEGDQVIGDVENSLFTHYLIEGLRSGAADRDEDGQITIDELYDYVYDHVLNETPKQTPGKWAFGQQGEIVIAQNPGVTVARLPPEIDEALKSTLPSVRFQVLTELFGIVRGRHEGRARAAREALQRLAEDDSRKVAGGAFLYLQALEKGEALAEDEWVRRVREREEEASGRKSVAAQIESYLATAQTSLERGALDEVRELLGRAQRLGPQEPAVRLLQERLEAAVEERARLEEAERRIRELRKRIAALIARANATEAHADAIALLDEALGLDPEHAEVRQLLETRHRLVSEAEAADKARRQQEAEAAALVQAEIERRAQLEGQLSEASRHLARENLTKAIVITEAVLRADPQNAAARTLYAKAQGAIEAKRLADEYAAQKRERQRHIEDMLATAEAAPTDDTAIDILQEVLAKDPGNEKAGQLLSKRQSAVAAARAEQRRIEADEIRRVRREELARETAESARGFSVQPTLMAQAWSGVRHVALQSNTFRIASVLLVALGVTWSALNTLNGPRDAAPAATEATSPAPPPTGAATVASARGSVPEKTPDRTVPVATADPSSTVAGRGERGTTSTAPKTSPGRGRADAGAARRGGSSPPTTNGDKPGSTAVNPAGAAPPPTVVNPPKPETEPPKVAEPAPARSEPLDSPAGGTKPAGGRTEPAGEATPPAPPPPTPNEESLRQAVDAFAAAVTSGSREAVRRVYPSVSDAELKEIDSLKTNFGRQQYKMTILVRKISIDGLKARVEGRAFHNGIDDRGKPWARDHNQNLTFEWTGRTWVRVR
jgi:Caspase domain